MANLSSAESWKQIYTASTFINFTSFDYATVKQSLIDYFKLYHPEFNNWIETDEFVMNIEAFAYICELYSYRLDMIGNENLLSSAQRKDSVLRLVKFISYKPSRVNAGSGLVKITSVRTSENVYDINGNNLANVKVVWNDINNPNWKHQFLTIVNSLIIQSLGDVQPKNRIQVFDQVFELYTLNNIPLYNGVIPYQATVHNKSLPLELVSCTLNEQGPVEQRPNKNNKFNILYSTDGLGDNSNYTGFFILTKQGTLSSTKTSFTNSAPHQFYDIVSENISDDVWLNQLSTDIVYWDEVPTINEQNVIFTDTNNKLRYEVETLVNDSIRVWFGDGTYSQIPSGDFEFWYRTSDPDATNVPVTAVSNVTTNFTYYDALNQTQNAVIEFSLVNGIQNGAPSEDIDHLKRNAPAVYYSQNRMVTAADYNSFLLQDNSILKLYSINRTYAGHSKYTTFNDASDTYQDINHFGSDLSVYFDTQIESKTVSSKIEQLTVVVNHIQPILSNPNNLMYRSLNKSIERRYFSDTEIHDIIFNFMGGVYYSTDVNPKNPVFPFAIYVTDKFTASIVTEDSWLIYVDVIDGNYVIKYKITELVANSSSTNFWTSKDDKIIVLDINTGNSRYHDYSALLGKNVTLPVVSSKQFKEQNLIGVTDVHSLVITASDDNKDGLPDIENIQLFTNNYITYDTANNDLFTLSKYDRLFNHAFDAAFDSDNISIPTILFDYEFPVMDIVLTGNVNNNILFAESGNLVTDRITITDYDVNSTISIKINDYVYFKRLDKNNPYLVSNCMRDWLIEYRNNNLTYTKRMPGRTDLKFLWQHSSKTSTRINPSTSNIIDCFIITRGYYSAFIDWIMGYSTKKPVEPSTSELMSAYSNLIGHKMVSDEMVLKSGQFKVLFGKYADDSLQAKFVVVRGNGVLTDIQIKSQIVDLVYSFFNINEWNFGDVFNFTELSSYIHSALGVNINSCVLVSTDFTNNFGTMFQVTAMENEIFIPMITVDDIDIVDQLSPTILHS